MIEIKNLSKIYTTGKVSFIALDNVSLSIEQGEFVAIMGQSGSGKSTLLHLLGLLDWPTTGSYILQGQTIEFASESKLANLRSQLIGFVFQQFHLLARTSAEANVGLPLIYSANPANSTLPQILLDRVGLGDKLPNLPNELSGGERQRVAIARSLVNDPAIIMADEPTGNLDSQSEAEVLKILMGLHQQGKTVILVTHEESLAQHADRIIRLKDGQIYADQRLKKKNDVTQSAKNIQEPKKMHWSKMTQYIGQAFTMILANKVRSFLSIIGILIGVGTLIATITLGDGAKASIANDLSRLGTNMVTIYPNRRVEAVPVRFNRQDMAAFKKLSAVKLVSPQVHGGGRLIYGNNNLSSQVLGTNPEAADMRNNKPEFGRYFTENELRKREKVVVIGKTVVRELFGEDNPIGKTLKINKIQFRIIGILPSMGGSHWRDRDSIVVIPLTTAMHRMFGKTHYDSIDIQIHEGKDTQKAIEEIKALVIKRHQLKGKRQETFRVINMAEIQETFQKTAKNLQFLLSFIASLSLLVGGIGIMNIMLVSVTERTREIGLRKAIGATRHDILFQFVIEAIVLTLTGGLMGIGLGIGIAAVLAHFANWMIVVTPQSLFMGTSFSVIVGLIFGIWPAKKASRLNPIDALRYE